MTKMATKIKGILGGIAAIMCIACMEAELTTAPDITPGEIEITFMPTLDGAPTETPSGATTTGNPTETPSGTTTSETPSGTPADHTTPTPETKAIGDAGHIDQLRASVYQITSRGLVFKEIVTEPWSKVQAEGLSLKLDSKPYKILFWAEDKDNSAYQITESGLVQANYADYQQAGFARMEELDAFFATSDVIPGVTEKAQKVVLKRPFAQLNFVDKLKPEEGSYQAKVTFASMPLAFNPFNGTVQSTDPDDPSDDITFSFTDFPEEKLTLNGKEYHYISSNYIFAPSKGTAQASCEISLTKDGNQVSLHEFKGGEAITLEPNKKVNMVDYMVPEPQKWSVWNGLFPTVCTLEQDPADQNCYIIDDAEDIAWLGTADNAGSLGEGRTFKLVTNIDMAGLPGQKSMKLPAGCTFDGNGFTITGIKMMVGLFGDVATELTVKNLNITNATVSSTTNAHKGILANTLCGSGTISNVTVSDSHVKTMQGAAGGLVGYISRKNPSDRAEKLNVLIDDCHVINTTIEADGNEGYFVGMFRGYDNGEVLTFKSNCSVVKASGSDSPESYIIEGNEAVWIKSQDFTKYNGWLGCEECYRGMVYFDGVRFIPKWDGVKHVTPLLADPTYDDSNEYKVKAGAKSYMIYSPFDLAGARKATATPMGLYFKESVDMNGQGEDGRYHVPKEFSNRKNESADDNWFKRFTYVRNIDGQNNTIYNLSLHSKAINDSSYIAAFINSVQGDSITVHKNLNFRNCCSVAPVVQRESETMVGQDLSGGAIFIYNTGPEKPGSPTYTMENIHVYDSQVFALQHSGILAGIVTRGNVRNCSVNNSYIENYKCTQTHERFEKNVTIAGSEITISANFYSYGEIGALVGMIRRESNISNCHVRNCIVHAYGEPDKEADMSSDGLIGKAAIATAKGLGYYLVPGRHVSTFVGDIRTCAEETINIDNCTVDSATKCTAEHYKHNSTFSYIGQAYYIQFSDSEGTVKVNGAKLSLADGNKNTKR